MRPESDFWRGKRVLVTGHTGFKGVWLSQWLQMLGAEVSGISLPPTSTPNLFQLVGLGAQIEGHFCDIKAAVALSNLIHELRPEVVFHLAAQPLVRASYRDPLATFASNIMGTANVLDAMRDLDSVRVAVMITTDKVYANSERFYPFREQDALGGHDPYSASKAACEIVIASYRDAFLAEQGIAVASARAGNVIGGGDWSEDRLIPDAVRAWQSGRTLEVRQPLSTRPWQHVLEPLAGYLVLAQNLWRQPALAGAFNFGPETHSAATVRNVVEIARSAFGKGDVDYKASVDGPHEAGWLALEVAKARVQLGVKPKWDLAETVKRTMVWYRSQCDGCDARRLCRDEIASYAGLL